MAKILVAWMVALMDDEVVVLMAVWMGFAMAGLWAVWMVEPTVL